MSIFAYLNRFHAYLNKFHAYLNELIHWDHRLGT